MFDFPVNSDIADLFVDFVTKNGSEGDHGELREEVKKVVFHYSIFITQADLFREGLVKVESETAKRMRRDFEKIKRMSKELMVLLETTKAGAMIRENLATGRYTKQDWEILSGLSGRAANAEEKYTTGKGRNTSRERQARIGLVEGLADLTAKSGIYTGTGQQGPFPDFIISVYERLGIIQYNLCKDLQQAIKNPTK